MRTKERSAVRSASRQDGLHGPRRVQVFFALSSTRECALVTFPEVLWVYRRDYAEAPSHLEYVVVNFEDYRVLASAYESGDHVLSECTNVGVPRSCDRVLA